MSFLEPIQQSLDNVARGPVRWPAVADSFLKDVDWEPTRDQYRRDLDCWADWCRTRHLDPLKATSEDVKNFARHLETIPLAAVTINRRLAACSSAHRDAIAKKSVSSNPFLGPKIRRKVTASTQTLGLDIDQVRHLLTVARDAGPLPWALTTLLAHCGLRISEPCAAKVTHLTMYRGHRVLEVTRKGHKRQPIYLAPETADVLDTYLAGRRHGPLLTRQRDPGRPSGQPLDTDVAYRIIKKIGQAAGLPRLKPHDLRHSWVTLCLDAGIPLADVQDGAGHADPRTTKGYDTGRAAPDRSPNRRLVNYLTGRTGPGGANPQGTLFG